MISVYWDVMHVLKTRLDFKLHTELNLEPVIPSESLALIQPHLTPHTVAREKQTLAQNAAVVLGKETLENITHEISVACIMKFFRKKRDRRRLFAGVKRNRQFAAWTVPAHGLNTEITRETDLIAL